MKTDVRELLTPHLDKDLIFTLSDTLKAVARSLVDGYDIPFLGAVKDKSSFMREIEFYKSSPL